MLLHPKPRIQRGQSTIIVVASCDMRIISRDSRVTNYSWHVQEIGWSEIFVSFRHDKEMFFRLLSRCTLSFYSEVPHCTHVIVGNQLVPLLIESGQWRGRVWG